MAGAGFDPAASLADTATGQGKGVDGISLLDSEHLSGQENCTEKQEQPLLSQILRAVQ